MGRADPFPQPEQTSLAVVDVALAGSKPLNPILLPSQREDMKKKKKTSTSNTAPVTLLPIPRPTMRFGLPLRDTFCFKTGHIKPSRYSFSTSSL